MKIRDVLVAMPNICDLSPKVDFSKHVRAATPQAITTKAWDKTSKTLWGAYIKIEEEHGGKKRKHA
jgi:hypothetical protein